MHQTRILFLIPTEAVDFHQFLTDADDVDTWMLDILRLVSSDDTGKDEANVQVSFLNRYT